MTDITNSPSEDHEDVDAPVEVQAETKLREPTAHEKRLRTEKLKERTARLAAEQALVAAKSDADQRVTAAQKAAEARIVKAEAKAAALQAGLVDLDAMAMIDLSTCSLDADGNVLNAAEAIAAAKKAKPYLFAAATTSSTAPSPRHDAPKEFDARTAPEAEVIAFERKMGLRR